MFLLRSFVRQGALLDRIPASLHMLANSGQSVPWRGWMHVAVASREEPQLQRLSKRAFAQKSSGLRYRL